MSTFQDEHNQILQQIEELGAAASLRHWFRDQGAAMSLSDRQARFLVDAYYAIQDRRKRSDNQVRALTSADEPAHVVDWLADSEKRLETWIAAALSVYVHQHKMGPWLEQAYGIGPTLGAGLLAYIDIHKAPTVGHIWQFCGIAGAGQHCWEANTKRPWSAQAKVLCYKLGESFIKFSNRPDCVYGQLYRQRKAAEIANNDGGLFAEQATREASKKGKDTSAWPWNAGCYPAGTCAEVMVLEQDKRDAFLKTVRRDPGFGMPMLHPGHINDRARRWAVKQFLADFHGAWYRAEFGKEPPLPYPVAHLNHVHIRAA